MFEMILNLKSLAKTSTDSRPNCLNLNPRPATYYLCDLGKISLPLCACFLISKTNHDLPHGEFVTVR